MIKEHGISKTSRFTKISRASLWRWKTTGINPKRRLYESKIFLQIKDILNLFLVTMKCTNANEIAKFIRNNHNIKVSTKLIYKFIKRIGFSKKRVKTRGTCKGDLEYMTLTWRT
jgi:transposase